VFQFVAILVLLGTGQTQSQIKPEPSFNTLQECADSIPDELLKLNEAAAASEHRLFVALGCLKTGERS
jgi:hypothetical protein